MSYIIVENKEGAGRYYYTSSDNKINIVFGGFSRARARRKLAKRYPFIIEAGANYIIK